MNRREYLRALTTMQYYQFDNPPYKFSRFLVQPDERKAEILTSFQQSTNTLVDVLAYCLMPNHFHFLLRQKKDQGITIFMTKFTNSYTKYFNTRHERVGPLVQGLFKSVWVEDDEQLLHLSRYIHLNPVTSFLIREKDLLAYQWSSFREYNGVADICDVQTILSFFKSPQAYHQFVYDQAAYAKSLKKIKDLTFES